MDCKTSQIFENTKAKFVNASNEQEVKVGHKISATVLLKFLILDAKEYSRLEQLPNFCIEKSGDIRKPREGQFLVIAHGDLWNNNIMFQYKCQDGER